MTTFIDILITLLNSERRLNLSVQKAPKSAIATLASRQNPVRFWSWEGLFTLAFSLKANRTRPQIDKGEQKVRPEAKVNQVLMHLFA